MKTLIGISGGIGSGKSVVSRVLRSMGHDVYDCDIHAREIMNKSRRIKCAIRDRISGDVTDGEREPDRKLLADIVFSNENARKILNEVVHAEVRDHLKDYHKDGVLWVEAAILAESGLADMCDRIWKIEAPTDERLKHIVARDNVSYAKAAGRMCAQRHEETLLAEFDSITDVIYNDRKHSVLHQIEDLLTTIEYIKDQKKE